MNFRDFYQTGKKSFSFEIFPPKDEKGVSDLFLVLKELSPLNPVFISVTYGAGGSTRDLTRDLAIRIYKELKLNVAFHFTCVGSGKVEIQAYVARLKKEGVNLVVALRGDPPKGETHFKPALDGFCYASELVTFLKKIDGFSIAVAGYPEGHVEAKSKEEDLLHLKEKVDAQSDIVLTQLFFDNRDYFDFIDRARNIGIKIPIVPGILPVLNLKQIQRIATLSGARIPEGLRSQLEDCQEDTDQMREVGIQHATKQCQELLQKGAPGIHFYILNKAYSVKKIIGNL